eukprot:3533535-Prymnesium_polylepis.1
MALVFFLSQSQPSPGKGEHPQLCVPLFVLGARSVFTGLDGTARFSLAAVPDPQLPLHSDLVRVELDGELHDVSDSQPFLAFQSHNQGFLGFPEYAEDLQLARRNRHPDQRVADSTSRFAFERQVQSWYTGASLTSYHPAVRRTLQQVVTSVGSGPWMAGLWFGDSQLGFLAAWIGHALAQATWRDSPAASGAASTDAAALPLDYYLYSMFTVDPANQCFVLPEAECA